MTFETFDQSDEEAKPDQRQRPWNVKLKCEVVVISNSDSWGPEFITRSCPKFNQKKSCPKWDGGADKSKREELLLRKSKKQQSWWQTETAATPIFRDTHTNTHNYTQLHVITQVAKKEALLVGTHTNTHNYTQLHMLTHVSKTARLFRIMLFEIYWKMAVLKLPFPVMLGSEALDGKWKRKPSLEPPFQMFMNMFSVSSLIFLSMSRLWKRYLPTYLSTVFFRTVLSRTVFFEVYSV